MLIHIENNTYHYASTYAENNMFSNRGTIDSRIQNQNQDILLVKHSNDITSSETITTMLS